MNRHEFPTLARAAEEMALDNGFSLSEAEQDLAINTICYEFLPDQLIRAEAELRQLLRAGDDLDSPFCTLLCGCEDDWPPVHDNTLRVVEALFNAL